jgi:hypothetical protein
LTPAKKTEEDGSRQAAVGCTRFLRHIGEVPETDERKERQKSTDRDACLGSEGTSWQQPADPVGDQRQGWQASHDHQQKATDLDHYHGGSDPYALPHTETRPR